MCTLQELPGETCLLWSVILLLKLHAWLNVLWLLRSAPKRLTCWMVLCSVPLPWDPALPCPALPPRHCVHTPASPTPGLGKAPVDSVHGHSCRAGYGMSDLHGHGEHVSVCFHTCVYRCWFHDLCSMNTHDHWCGGWCAADTGALSGPVPCSLGWAQDSGQLLGWHNHGTESSLQQARPRPR